MGANASDPPSTPSSHAGATTHGGRHQNLTSPRSRAQPRIPVHQNPHRSILDTSIWPERRNFSNRNIGPIPSRWHDACDSGPGFPSSHCNCKLVGARFFAKGHDAASPFFNCVVTNVVDVLSISIGGREGVTSPYYLDPIAIGAYGAVSHVVLISASVGNDGPTSMSVTNLAPWITTVGASTLDWTFPADVTLRNGNKLAGVSINSGPPLSVHPHSFASSPTDNHLLTRCRPAPFLPSHWR